MEKTIIGQESKKAKSVSYKQAVVGLELGSTDHGILNYLNFFTKNIAVESSLFIKVIPVFDLYKAMFEKEIPSLSESIATNNEIRQQLESKVKGHFLENDHTELGFLVEEGNTLEKITTAAENLKADLLVIGHKESQDRQNIIGKNLIRQTEATSLIIPENAKPQLSKILVPIDFSNDSQKALQQAVSIQKQMGFPTKIVALHVYKMLNFNSQKLSTTWAAHKENKEKSIMEGFHAFLYSALGEDANQVEVILQEAKQQNIPDTILSFAKENHSDLIVIGARGHSKIHLLLIGSTTESLLDLNREIPMMITKL